MMEKVLLFILLGLAFSISSKLDDIVNSLKDSGEEIPERKRMKRSGISKMIGKRVILNIDQDEINDSYLFSEPNETEGVIKEVGNAWIVFEYETKKEIVTRYFRIDDVVGIDEVK